MIRRKTEFYQLVVAMVGLQLPRNGFHIFVRGGVGVDKYMGGGVLLLALAGAWWQRPERPRKMFNKTCFLGLRGGI
jgi:hypothetical protein